MSRHLPEPASVIQGLNKHFAKAHPYQRHLSLPSNDVYPRPESGPGRGPDPPKLPPLPPTRLKIKCFCVGGILLPEKSSMYLKKGWVRVHIPNWYAVILDITAT